jgi:hypothetical protein
MKQGAGALLTQGITATEVEFAIGADSYHNILLARHK